MTKTTASIPSPPPRFAGVLSLASFWWPSSVPRAGKPVVLMLSTARLGATSRCGPGPGPLVGDYETMRAQVEDAGAIVVTTMDEMMDLAEILVRYPKPPVIHLRRSPTPLGIPLFNPWGT